ncbi:homoserine O-succinyltransferase [Aerococcaceae bacterium DSM 111022]|nr:homoserine O-succinyltransferase [Aerococcaceae bacterium DSM 111022]
MPIKIAEGLPVKDQLEQEGIFIMEQGRALTQHIRPLHILIVNLMPLKQTTELQLLRLIGNTPIQLEVDFLHMGSHESKNTDLSYLKKFYLTLDDVKNNYYDGMIVTGAPVETLEFDQVEYIKELNKVMEWSESHVFNRFFICWGAQFAINYYYKINKVPLDEKLFGIYHSHVQLAEHPYLRGMDDVFHIPQSRHTTIKNSDILAEEDLVILSSHPENGADLVMSKDSRDVFIFGHLEYDRDTLEKEYHRDLERGDEIQPPINYYPDNNPEEKPYFNWRSHGHLLFTNWINVTYQETLYDLSGLEKRSHKER